MTENKKNQKSQSSQNAQQKKSVNNDNFNGYEDTATIEGDFTDETNEAENNTRTTDEEENRQTNSGLKDPKGGRDKSSQQKYQKDGSLNRRGNTETNEDVTDEKNEISGNKKRSPVNEPENRETKSDDQGIAWNYPQDNFNNENLNK
jgi:hypothetical protein